MKFKLLNPDFRIPRADMADGVINPRFLVSIITINDEVYAESKVNENATSFTPVHLTVSLIEGNPTIFERV
jgi:hypothetical protein